MRYHIWGYNVKTSMKICKISKKKFNFFASPYLPVFTDIFKRPEIFLYHTTIVLKILKCIICWVSVIEIKMFKSTVGTKGNSII